MTMKAIDLFAGAGGLTEGARMSGVKTIWAANHWRNAVDTHAANHPETEHSCQDLQQADWRECPEHDILMAAPACQGHSTARGKDQPHHDALRSTAWAVVSCAEYHRPPFVLVENVPEFLKWALYPCWKDAMNRLGYSVSENVIDAADVGVPQNRRRMFLICTRSSAEFRLDIEAVQHRPINDVINWEGSGWKPIYTERRSRETILRVYTARKNHGDRFLFSYYSSPSSRQGRSIDRPVGTITTKDRWAIVRGHEMRMMSVQEAKAAMGFPDEYVLPAKHVDAMKMLGNAVCPPVAAEIIRQIKAAA